MNKYQSYKSSSVEWVGEIPKSWEETRLKYVGNLYGGLTGKSGEDFKQEDNPNNKPYIPYTNIFRNTYISKNHIDYVVLGEDEKQNKVQKFDLFFLMSSETYQDLGKPCILVDDIEELYLNSFCKGFRVNSIDISPLFLNYQLLGSVHKELISIEGRGFTRINLRQDRLNETPIFLPPLNEQLQIVQFLDEKTELVDKLISTKERKITLLKEQRISIINQVVTKGLNPNVKMKDSDIEWIGEIPEMWSMGKLNYLCKRIGDGIHSTPIYTDNSEYYFINGNNIKENKIVIFENTKTVEYEEYKKNFIELDKNNTLLLSINGTIGNLGYYNNEKVILGKSVSYINVIPNSIKLDYLFYLLGSSSIQNYFIFELTGTTIYNLSLNTIRKTPICLPDKTEQVQIVEYLNSKIKEIDDLVQLEQKKIDLLKEYRQSLISEVVTGKIKVTTDE